MGGTWEKSACFSTALSQRLLGAGHEKGAAGVPTARGNGEVGSRGLLRASLAEEFYLLCPATPTQQFYPLGVKYQKDISGIWSERPSPM